MKLLDKYQDQLRLCKENGMRVETKGHYKTKIDFNGEERVYVAPDGSDIVRYRFDVRGCAKTKTITQNGRVKRIKFHKDRLPVFGTITRQKNLKAFLYKFLLFLRCDGIEDKELMKLYLLHCLAYKFEFWRKDTIKYEKWELYNPEYHNIEKMINGLIKSAVKKVIDDKTMEQFIVRSCCVVNPKVKDIYGKVREKTTNEIRRDAKIGQRMATDNRIKTLYDPALKDAANAYRIGISVRRLQEWKADNKANNHDLETVEQKITRLFDPSLSLRKNAQIIGCSVNSIRKYKKELTDTVQIIS